MISPASYEEMATFKTTRSPNGFNMPFASKFLIYPEK